jgi:hypothetical protein
VGHLKRKRKEDTPVSFNLTFLFIDMSFHRIIHSLVTIVGSIYPIEIEIKDTTDIAKTAMNTLDLHL